MKLSAQPHLALLALSTHATSSPVTNYHEYDSNKDLLVKTPTFAVQGTVWPNNSAVHFYGNIPSAEPPIDTLRFRPPVTKAPSSDIINGSWFGPSCIQYNNWPAYCVLGEQSEDCLTLNVWAPKDVKAGDDLPVLIWIHGGGHTSGGAASPYKYGDRLARDQNVIVVAMNYRVNIFGFPGAAALDGRNLNPGLLDQSKAVEWTYANIDAFGGNPEQMILFGQSAGGSSVDLYSYAYPFDPLVKGFIAQSGVASNGIVPTGSNFTYIASQLNCSSSTNTSITSPDAELSCMQSLPATSIISIYNTYNSTLKPNSRRPPNSTKFHLSSRRCRRGKTLF
ncbi:Putative carboxylesterase, type B, carboxylesterase type B, carboxylesterase type B, active [Septoria linicola]|uniref:Carboxylic ester hydrolase n=1 Tax=Septoria linicola TaxID=215465 RepID=A0A9Q9ATG6_9PEZI|nr:Putative carboxylesterase, type B, carboxylesterase type B, carboxylesterase type B, active [Septoria linicola]